ncbi:MAG: hypothetical protein L0922_05825 [Candidatus Mariimomonas ferrooxydans]
MQQINQQMPAKQSDGTASRQHKRIERIRARASYMLFQKLYDFLEERPAIADILRKFNNILNVKCSFGSRKNAEYAEESLDWVLKDKGG